MSIKEEVILDLVDNDLSFACIVSHEVDVPELMEEQLQEIGERAGRFYASLR